MKCGFCGKELTEGAEFCPECGMILSLGGVTNEPDEVKLDEVEVPEYTPNVFRAMDFEEETVVPAMELEVTDEEETAEVVEIIPEYTEEQETAVIEEPAEEPQEEFAEEATEKLPEEEETAEEEFAVPEYDPNAAVSDEFLQRVAVEEPSEPVEFEETEKEVEEEPVEEEIQTEAEETADDEFAPPEYEGELTGATEAYEVADGGVETEEVVEAYPVYDEEVNVAITEEAPAEDESFFAALFESDEAEKIEDITPTPEKPVKKSKNNFGAVIAVIVILACVILGGGYIFKNVIPAIENPTETTTTEAGEKVDGTTEKTTTEKNTTEKTTDKKETTTKPTTTKPTTTEKPTEATTDSGEVAVVEPSAYDLDEVPFFPKDGDISIKSAPSASGADMISHPYGYPVFAYAKEGNYYYVHSAYHDFMGWVYAKDIVEYTEEEQTEAAQPEQEVTDAPESESDVSYIAMIGASEGLNFRTGPGYDYASSLVVPGGFYVRVTAVSEENPGWVYVTVEDDRYPYGTPGGWVLEEYLI